MKELPLRFTGLAVSSSVDRNVEINHKDANKGAVLTGLASRLGLTRSQVMSFGDGLNDISMIREPASASPCKMPWRKSSQLPI